MRLESRRHRRLIRRGLIGLAALALLWLTATVVEWRLDVRLLPFSAYQGCGDHAPASLPSSVRVGFYEEFPAVWRLDKLRLADFPLDVAVAASSRAGFTQLRDRIRQTYPQVRDVYFWPTLTNEEGYYPGSWSDSSAVKRAAHDADGEPVLWDLEMPPHRLALDFGNWWRNRAFVDQWLKSRKQPVALWRPIASMGLDPLFLRLVAMHFDPLDYPVASLHLDLYMTGAGESDAELTRILRCGVERYGARFIPAFGVLNDGEGTPGIFVPPETLRRNLRLARESGVSEVWLFGVNGLSADVVSMLHETLPLEKLPTPTK